MRRIAIFASGSGTNAERIARYFKDHPSVHVDIILSNRKDAFVLQRAKKLNIESMVFSRDELNSDDGVISRLKARKTDLIVLAGFLWLIPKKLIAAFPEKIVNIHPALLPNYGGKNMYGMKVHEAVIESGDKESGITIHLVDEMYDHGKILFQAKCEVNPDDTPDMLAQKIHQLEYEHFPVVIEKFLSS
jgi:phosphoribosylglycinamide formyltransferase 1